MTYSKISIEQRIPFKATTAGRKRVFVAGGLLGQGAGVHLANWLLCSEMASSGFAVTCFAPAIDWGGTPPKCDFRIVTPRIHRGYRWDWPDRCLSLQVRWQIHQERPDLVLVIGVTRFASYLLRSDVAGQLAVWELTNANDGNKFVDPEAVRLLNRCRAVLSPSQAIDDNIRRNYGYTGRLLRLPFWIEDWQQPCQKSPARFLADFIYLGRRDEEKGLRELLRASAEVAKHFPGVRVLIAGQGSAEPYARLADELGLQNNIRFEYFKERAEMLEALAKSRFLALPSYHEGYPLVLLEAAQMGVPFVATTVGSIPEVFGATRAGLLCPPRDDCGLADAMLRLLRETPSAYQARRLAARQVFQKVSSKVEVDKMLQRLFKELAK